MAINYNASEDRAKQVEEKIRKDYDCKTILVKGVTRPQYPIQELRSTEPHMQDQGILADCENTVQSSIDGLGGLDIIVSNAVSMPFGFIQAHFDQA